MNDITPHEITPASPVQKAGESPASTTGPGKVGTDFAELLARITRESSQVAESAREELENLDAEGAEGSAEDVLSAINRATEAYETLSRLGAELTNIYGKAPGATGAGNGEETSPASPG